MRTWVTVAALFVALSATLAAQIYFMPITEVGRQALMTLEGIAPDYQIHIMHDRASSLCLVIVRHVPTGQITAVSAPEDTCASRR